MYKLIGSTTSPYVRRIRVQLSGQDYEFKTVNVFTEDGQSEIAKYTTTGRIPLLVDQETIIWDSLLIAEYLSLSPLDLDIKKNLVLINEMTDAGVQLFQLRKFDIDPKDEGLFSQNHLKRIGHILDYFENQKDMDWKIIGQWLWCTLDWFDFRDIYLWREARPNLEKFFYQHADRQEMRETDPR